MLFVAHIGERAARRELFRQPGAGECAQRILLAHITLRSDVSIDEARARYAGGARLISIRVE